MDTNLMVRLIVSIITIINLFAVQFGFDPLGIDEGSVYTIVSTLVAVIAWVWGFWKNNNFTDAAKDGQKVIDDIKANKKGDNSK